MHASTSNSTARLPVFAAFIFTTVMFVAAAAFAADGTAGAAHHVSADKLAPPNIATFSVAAYDPSTGEVGVAVQSRFFAVGSVVPYAKAGVGAVATQAYGYALYGTLGLDLMARGFAPDDAIGAIELGDDKAAQRQVGMVSCANGGSAATFTGDECMDWAGGLTGTTADGVVYAVQGNILTGQDVVGAMAFYMEHRALPDSAKLTDEEQRALNVEDFAGRLLGTLLAGEAAGGDSRGMQSSAMYIEQAGAGYGGYTDAKYDLRVDDAEDPFNELARLLNLARPFTMITDGYKYAYAGDFDKAFQVFQDLIELDPDDKSNHYHYACALALSGDSEAALEHLKIALEYEPDLAKQAATDPDLASLRDLPEFKALVPEQPADDTTSDDTTSDDSDADDPDNG